VLAREEGGRRQVRHVDDPRLALREMRRRCRPGGVVADRDSDYAGFGDVVAGSSTWCFATVEELAEVAAGWRRWSRHGDAWFSVLHGEMRARA
jgi:hypothetical protein